jgi:hypothetical protein
MKKMLLRLAGRTALVLSMGAASFGQRYTQTNLVSNTAGLAPVTDPQFTIARNLDCLAARGTAAERVAAARSSATPRHSDG